MAAAKPVIKRAQSSAAAAYAAAATIPVDSGGARRLYPHLSSSAPPQLRRAAACVLGAAEWQLLLRHLLQPAADVQLLPRRSRQLLRAVLVPGASLELIADTNLRCLGKFEDYVAEEAGHVELTGVGGSLRAGGGGGAAPLASVTVRAAVSAVEHSGACMAAAIDRASPWAVIV